ncbi:MAG: YitT family protein [Clostridia bacterium]|nr:YitT family protein [Clostridia bacterium]
MSTNQIENEVLEAVENLTKKEQKPKKYDKVVKPIKIRGTHDVNIQPTTFGGKLLKGIWSYIIITVGTLFVACGIYFFKFPNHFTVGGVSSLSVVLANYFPISESQFMAIANALLLILGLIIFGKQFAIKTVYSSALLSVSTLVMEKLHPIIQPITGDKFLELLFTIGGIAIGSAILFSQEASSGGTDIIAMILKKFTNVNIGTALLLTDVILVILGGVAFGIEIALYSLCGLVIKSFIVDTVIDGINLNKCFIVVTDKADLLCEFINNELHRGATVSICRGSFTHDDKQMIITVLNRQQAALFKKFIKQNDNDAFTIITNSTDILGKGFRIV